MKRLLLVLVPLCLFGAPVVTAQDAGWVSLFDGRTLNGWQPSENPQSFQIEDGAIVTRGPRSHLFYVGDVANHDFRNVEFEAEVRTTPGSNGGIYVHTKVQGPGFPAAGYELQVINSNPPLPAASPNAYVEHKMTGSIYAVRNTATTVVKDNEWFRYRIRVVGKTIQTYINDVLTCEYTEPDSPFRPSDKQQRLLGSGTFAIQAHDPASVVYFRALRVRVLPDTATSTVAPVADRELDELVTRLSSDNYPLIDVGLVPPDGAARQAFEADLRRFGVTAVSGAQVADALARAKGSVFVVNDRAGVPAPEALQAIKATGAKIVFSSGGESRLDETRFKQRLQAIRAAKLAWQDFWVPGKN